MTKCPPPCARAFYGLRVVSPRPQGLQGSHLHLSLTSTRKGVKINNSCEGRLSVHCILHWIHAQRDEQAQGVYGARIPRTRA